MTNTSMLGRFRRLVRGVFTRSSVDYRYELRLDDRDILVRILNGTGFFSAAEVAIALELIEIGIEEGESSGYQFIIAEQKNRVVGYACFGLIPATQARFDLYWIAVDKTFQQKGVGKQLLHKVEDRIVAQGGERVYVDTSSRSQYAATHRFYTRCGYHLEAHLEDFFAPGDGKHIYCKNLISEKPGISHK